MHQDAAPPKVSFGKQLREWAWPMAEPLHSALCLPGAAVPLLLGVLLGYPGTGVLMAGGAQTVGSASFQQSPYRTWSPMLAAAVAIALSAMVGALCRDSTPLLLAAVVVWTALYGVATSVSASLGWVGLQSCVFLIVSSAAPAMPGSTHELVLAALLRGAGVLAGGLLQTLLLAVLGHYVPQAKTHFAAPGFDATHLRREFLREQLRAGSPTFQYTVRLVATVVLAVAVYRQAHFQNAYWIGMTAVLIPRPDWSQTAVRSILRVAGTIAGAAICTLLVVEVRPHGAVLALLVTVFLYGTFLLSSVNYGAFALMQTGYICFLLAIVHQPAHDVLLRRVGATAAGCALATGVHLVTIGVRHVLGVSVPLLHTLEERIGWHTGPQRGM